MRLSPLDVEKTKKMLQKDVAQYNSDIKLLSQLLGRPLSAQDIEKLARTNLGKASAKPTITTTTPRSTTTTQLTTKQMSSSSSQIPAFKSLSQDEVKFLQALQQIQTTQSTTTTATTTTERAVPTRSKSREAIIAALLQQQGIGPNINGINQIQLDVRSN